jgi:hypothetical protein
MVTVEVDAAGVERRLGAGELACPGCGNRLAGWGYARARSVRGLQGLVPVRPRRARCVGCGGTHVLLPVTLLVRRADTVEVIGVALVARAAGAGHRVIAERLGRPAVTVRGWLRRFAGRLEPVRSFFTVVMVRVGIDPVLPAAAGSLWADAITAIGAAWQVLSRRFDVAAATVWQSACALSGGELLSPSWPPIGPAW